MTKNYYALGIIFCFFSNTIFAQTNYSDMANWAYHPNKLNTPLDGFNINISVIDADLNTVSIVNNTNNSKINTGVDVFFVHPTVLLNMASYTTIENIEIANQNASLVANSIKGQAGLLSKYGRMFAPRYRQATPPTFLANNIDATQANVIGVAYSDVKAAFLNYLQNYNNGNKIIIASHSQGATMAGMLLRDVFDNDIVLRQKLVVAVIAGIISNYAQINETNGGWWQNIPFCTQQNECGCVMNWKSFKENQIPTPPQSSHPCSNSLFVSNGWVYNQLNATQSWVMQDALYYTDVSQPLQNFVILKGNAAYGGTSGYVAYNNMYQIRHFRNSSNQVGFLVNYTPEIGDQRPNPLLEEESEPAFATFGYHKKDYNIYTWALMAQIDLKLGNCAPNLTTSNFDVVEKSLKVFQMSASKNLSFQYNDSVFSNKKISLVDSLGRIILEAQTDYNGTIAVDTIPKGFYIVITDVGKISIVIN